MAIIIKRPASSIDAPTAQFRNHIRSRVSDAYCSMEDYSRFVKFGVDNLAFERQTAKAVLDVTLETLSVVNEPKLVQELESILHRFTFADKRLDAKEKTNAIQLVCKARMGYGKGLSHEVAEQTILNYCRANDIKVKTGFLSWSVP